MLGKIICSTFCVISLHINFFTDITYDALADRDIVIEALQTSEHNIEDTQPHQEEELIVSEYSVVNISECDVDTDQIKACFSDLQWAKAVAAKVGAVDENDILTTAMLHSVTELSGADIAPYITGVAGVNRQLPTIENLGLFPNLIRISNFNFSGQGLTSIGDIDAWVQGSYVTEMFALDFSNNQLTSIGDLGMLGTLTNMTDLYDLNFSNNQLTDVGDLGEWKTLTNLVSLHNIHFSNNQLTTIGDLGQWAQLFNLTDIARLSFENNQLTTIGDISQWKTMPNLSVISRLDFSNNQLSDIGNLGEWKTLNLVTLTRLDFSNNQLSDIGDLGEWQALTTLTELNRILFSNNQLTNIGDLGKWGALTNLIALDNIDFSNNQLSDIGNLNEWMNLSLVPLFFTLDFSDNQIGFVTIAEANIAKFNQVDFSRQQYQQEPIYLNKNGLIMGAASFVDANIHNAFNYPDGTKTSYTLIPTTENYRLGDVIGSGTTLSITGDYVEDITINIGQNKIFSYNIEQEKGTLITYSATIDCVFNWIDLSIIATDFAIPIQRAATSLQTNSQLIEKANAQVVFEDEHGNVATLAPTLDEAAFTTLKNAISNQSLGTYTISFAYTHLGFAVHKSISVELGPNNLPTMTTTEPIIVLDLQSDDVNTNMMLTENIYWQDVEDTNNLTVLLSEIEPNSLHINGAVDISVAGTYAVEYRITDSDGNLATLQRLYLVAPLAYDDEYVLYANDFTIVSDQIAQNEVDKKQQILTEGNVFAEKLSNQTRVEVEIFDLAGYAAIAGTYHIHVGVKEKTSVASHLLATVTASPLVSPPTIDTTDKDFLLEGENFTIQATELKETLKNNTLESVILRRSGASLKETTSGTDITSELNIKIIGALDISEESEQVEAPHEDDETTNPTSKPANTLPQENDNDTIIQHRIDVQHPTEKQNLFATIFGNEENKEVYLFAIILSVIMLISAVITVFNLNKSIKQMEEETISE